MSEKKPETSTENYDEQVQIRQEKLQALREKGQPYPNHFRPQNFAADCCAQYADKEAEELKNLEIRVSLAGRMITRRLMGKASFWNLQDSTASIQVYVRRDDLEDGVYQDFKSWDLGDLVYIEGHLFKTKTGELSVWADKISLACKSLHPLPDKYHGLSDPETRYRQRYIDLLANLETRDRFIKKIQSNLLFKTLF